MAEIYALFRLLEFPSVYLALLRPPWYVYVFKSYLTLSIRSGCRRFLLGTKEGYRAEVDGYRVISR